MNMEFVDLEAYVTFLQVFSIGIVLVLSCTLGYRVYRKRKGKR